MSSDATRLWCKVDRMWTPVNTSRVVVKIQEARKNKDGEDIPAFECYRSKIDVLNVDAGAIHKRRVPKSKLVTATTWYLEESGGGGKMEEGGGNASVVDNKDKERGCNGATKQKSALPSRWGASSIIFHCILKSGGWESLYWVLVG